MAEIRTIEYTVTEQLTLTPTATQEAGVQGDDRATAVRFTLPTALTQGYRLQLMMEDGRGGVDVTDTLTVKGTDSKYVEYILPLSWTQHGGEIKVRLMAFIYSESGAVTQAAYSFEGRLRFRDKTTFVKKVGTHLEDTLVEVLAGIDDAQGAATNAIAACSGAQIAAEEAAGSATAAANAAVAAGKSETAAQEAQTAAENAATAAADSKTAAQEAQTAAESAADTATAKATAAAASAASAAASAAAAESSAENAAASATAATAAQAAAEAAATNAETSAQAAQSFADNAQTARAVATENAQNAEQNAAVSCSNAEIAYQKATEAADSAALASTSAASAVGTVQAVQESVIGLVPLLINNAGAHNATYRGKNLGTGVTAEQWAAIANGTFADLYIGDYWVIGGVNWRIAAFDYYYKTGDTSCTTHHAVIVPDTNLYTHVMNDTNTTDGGYVGSRMYTEGLTQAKTTICDAFGASHILTHRQLLVNAVTNGKPSGGAWYDSTVELMTEQNVYGGKIFGAGNVGSPIPYLQTIDKSQFPLFAHDPSMISNRQWFWLRDVVSAAYFAFINATGNASYDSASSAHGVRPAFAIMA